MGNEFGEILICVLTAAEGVGLEKMASGLMERYTTANEPPPLVMYVDRDCCFVSGSKSKVHELYCQWPNLQVRLDIYHFIRRLASGCTTDAHQLLGTYMASLSSSIFEWDPEDMQQLKDAKKAELQQKGFKNVTPAFLSRHISRDELARHCRRRTRGVTITSRLITELITKMDAMHGRDSLGVPLLDSEKIWSIWETQQRHVKCIQDPPGVQLYTQTGTLKKGGIDLKVFRCARGSTSLESYHLHLNRFIPGKSITCIPFSK